jgi:alpha-beta hydrolase superfamily lysophospholipase
MLPIHKHIAAVRKGLKPLSLIRKAAFLEAEWEYFRHYGLDIPGAEHHFGVIAHTPFKLASHVFVPKKCRGTAVLVHGYLEHSGYFRHAAQRLVKEGYAVVLFDLPGHGLSSGSPATIRDFSFYAAALDRVVRFSARKLKAPLHLVAHSMGCSAAVELLLTKTSEHIGKVVLAAPLVHPRLWPATKFAYTVLSPVVKKVPRAFPFLSSDKDFIYFTLFRDPMLRKEIPLHWVHSMLRWNEHLARYSASDKELRIFQGTNDLLVDWKYNLAYLKTKFPNARVRTIKDANHQLFNESEKIRTKTLDAIVEYLKKR